MQLDDPGGRVGDVRGTITIGGVRHLVKGRRLGARCGFGIISEAYGAPEGMGYIEWAPSGERAQKIKDRDENDTDHIIVGVSLPKEYPSGTEQTMNRG